MFSLYLEKNTGKKLFVIPRLIRITVSGQIETPADCKDIQAGKIPFFIWYSVFSESGNQETRVLSPLWHGFHVQPWPNPVTPLLLISLSA